MPGFCDQLDNLMVMTPEQMRDFIDTVVNKELMEKYGYDPVNIKADDPANPHCGPNEEACWSDEDQTLYYNEERISQKAQQDEIVETLAHESLHGMDYQDRGNSSEGLDDEVSEKYTVRLYNEYGEDGEKMYGPGDDIPGEGHSEEVYKPAREIAKEMTELCKKLKKAKTPEAKESIKNEIQKEIQEILDNRWDADDDEGDDGESDDGDEGDDGGDGDEGEDD
jgi:hypothetical protein